MIFSHSKINLLLEDMFSYFLNYKIRVEPLQKQKALLIGEAVHYALENKNSDLTQFFKDNGSFEQKNTYSEEQVLSESLASTYLEKEEEIQKKILGDAKIIEIYKELEIKVKMKKSDNEFLGIIDLLFLTDKGFIIVDYKTTSKTPNYDDYLEQLYRYCMLLNYKFPEISIYKIAIISLRKSSLRRKMNEDIESFKRRMILDYKERSDEYIDYHIFEGEIDKRIFNDQVLDQYKDNMENLIKTCEKLDDSNIYPIVYKNAITIYGKSTYYDFIYWNEESIRTNFIIKDHIYNEYLDEFVDQRTINDLDLEIIKNKKLDKKYIIKFNTFKEIWEELKFDKKLLTKKYKIDKNLLEIYILTYLKERELVKE